MEVLVQDNREERIIKWCARYIGDVINIDPRTISADDDLDSYGLDSSIMTSMVFDMEEWLKVDIPISVLFEQRTLRGIAAELVKRMN